MNKTASEWVRTLELKPHPEGGYYRETYRSAGTLLSPHGQRHYSTAIYFLLEKGNFSAFHRIRSDELWHFYDGDPLLIYILNKEGLRTVRLGKNPAAGELPQAVVPAHTWFASKVAEGGVFGLAGCTVSPGFDFADFQMAKRYQLLTEFPAHEDLILELTRG